MPNWTNEQKRAICEKGNLLVSAAAGAGKTAVMTERIVKIISEGVSVNEILAVTFTNAAASEMKQRIAKRLSELAENEKSFEKRLILSAAANDISHAAVSTFHSFCGNLLRRCCSETELDPAFRVADAAEALLIKYSALDETLEEAYLQNEASPSPSFSALCSVLKNDAVLSELILSVYNFIMARPEPFSWLKTAVSAYSEGFGGSAEKAGAQLIKIAKRNIRFFYEQADALYCALPSVCPDAPMKYEHALFSDMEFLNALLQLPRYEAWHNALEAYSLSPLPRSKKGEKAPSEITSYRNALKKLLKKLSLVFSESLETERREAKANFPVMNEILNITERFHKKYMQKKKEASLVDFNDLEQLTLSALKNPEIASEYRDKFKYIFIDEYQDTNSIQEKILSLIAGKDNLFMVGDVKQSIYRFRQAEPENFLDKYLRYDGKFGTRIDLNTNFRSSASVISAVNFLFSKLMKGEIGEIDYSDNAALIPSETAARGKTEIVILTKNKTLSETEEGGAGTEASEEDGTGGSADCETNNEMTAEADGEENSNSSFTEEEGTVLLDSARAEALFAAEKILFLIENSYVFDKALNKKRRPVFSDFAVLLRKTKNSAMQWVNILTAAGIPCAADLGDGFFDAAEVLIFMNLLRIIDNGHQDIPLMSVLCSPIGNFTNKELISVRCDYEGDDLYSKLLNASLTSGASSEKKNSEAENGNVNKTALPRAKSFIEKLSRWQKESRFMKLDEFIGTLLDSTAFYAYAGALKGGQIRKANLDMLVNYAHNYEKNGRGGLYGFINFMDNISDKANISAASSPALNAVHIMSIHKSKGLEFPIVFIGGLFNSFSEQTRRDSIILDPALGIGLKLRNKKLSKTLLHRAILIKDDEKKLAEEMRILYVAMTRARETLYMIGCPQNKDFDIEKYAEPLSDYRIMNAKTQAKWILGAFFSGKLPENSGGETIKVSRALGKNGDEITLTVRSLPSVSFSFSNKSMSREAFAAWKNSVLLSYTENAEAVCDMLHFDYPYKEAAAASSKKSVTELMGVPSGYSPAVPAFMEKNHIPTGAEKGTAVHRILELMPLKNMNKEELSEQISNFIKEGKLTAEFSVSVLLCCVSAYFESQLYERAVNSERVEREIEFSLLLSPADIKKVLRHKSDYAENNEISSLSQKLNEGSLLQGVIDCCFLENGEWVIIDYKTTASAGFTPFEIASRYETQLDMYALALEKLTGFPVKEKWIFLTSAGTAVLIG